MNIKHSELSMHIGHRLTCKNYYYGKYATIECEDCCTLLHISTSAVYQCPKCNNVHEASEWDKKTSEHFKKKEIVFLDQSILNNLKKDFVFMCPSCEKIIEANKLTEIPEQEVFM